MESPPSRGAWIEIGSKSNRGMEQESPPSRGAWIEILLQVMLQASLTESPPSRGAWIEMTRVSVRSMDGG